MNESKFQFKSFSIRRSLIERFKVGASKQISLNFSPKGTLNKVESSFQLDLGLIIEDENKSFVIEIDASAFYKFENSVGLDDLNTMFYFNAPALLFPYVRAYISTLTNLSGFEPVNLPTLNMTGLGERLKENTEEI